MKKLVTVLVLFALGGLLLAYMVQETGKRVSVEDLPWKVEALADGRSRVFGVILGQSTLREVIEHFGTLPEVGLFVAPNGDMSLEAYFGRLRLGLFEAKVIAMPAVDEASLRRYAGAKVSDSPMPSGARKLELTEAHLKEVYALTVAELTYVPAVQYETDVVTQRFGEPAEQLVVDDTRTYWLYPDMGLAMMIDSDGKEVLQYVAPRDFPGLRERVLAEVPGAG